MRDRSLRIAVLTLSLVGIGVATYLTWIHYAGIKPICTGGGSCLKVQTSEWAEVGGIPVALIGLIGYVSIFLSALLLPTDAGRVTTAALTFIGFGFSLYLTYLEIFEIHAICEWCASSAGIMTLLAILSVLRIILYRPERQMEPSSS